MCPAAFDAKTVRLQTRRGCTRRAGLSVRSCHRARVGRGDGPREASHSGRPGTNGVGRVARYHR